MFKSQNTKNLLEVSVNSISQNINFCAPGDGNSHPKLHAKGERLHCAEGEELGDPFPQTACSTRRFLRETVLQWSGRKMVKGAINPHVLPDVPELSCRSTWEMDASHFFYVTCGSTSVQPRMPQIFSFAIRAGMQVIFSADLVEAVGLALPDASHAYFLWRN